MLNHYFNVFVVNFNHRIHWKKLAQSTRESSTWLKFDRMVLFQIRFMKFKSTVLYVRSIVKALKILPFPQEKEIVQEATN